MDMKTLIAQAQTVNMIIVVVAFIGIVAYALWPSQKQNFDHAANLPLTED
jgi:cytochrome c oxidase cbb3-type subunit IV